MPAVPLYLHRLADGIAALETRPEDLIDRRTLEEALGVGKWTAWRIMKRCGAFDGPGNTLVCYRQDLVRQLQGLQQDGRFSREISRRGRVERYLDSMADYARQKQKEIARNQAAQQLLDSRFQNLPSGVELCPGELRIAFTGAEDFLQKFAAVVFALQNDFERIECFINPTAGRASSPSIHPPG
jgi:hypothetical protein